MSPRSAAEYVRKKLKHDAAKRKKKRRRKKISGGGDVKTKKKKKRKGKRKRKRKRRTDGETSEEELTRPKQKPFKPEDQHFYPTPRNLFKKRCVFTAESKPVACTSKTAVCLPIVLFVYFFLSTIFCSIFFSLRWIPLSYQTKFQRKFENNH